MLNFDTVEEIINYANKNKKSISQVTLEQTAIDMNISEDEVKNLMHRNLIVMKEAIKNGLNKNLKSTSGLTGNMGYKMKQAVDNKKNISGNILGEILYSALATSEINASMGKIVAAPTAGSCGIIPACFIALQNNYNFSDEEIIMALINSSAIGIVIAKNASISGATGGCQAECGSSAAMAASGITELFGGTPEMCGHSVAQALKSLMGLVCDPVAGLVEEPCIIRNASSGSIALVSAELSLAGIESIIPVDQVIEAMKSVGEQMPSCLKETSEGGIAITKRGLEIKKIFEQ